MSTDVVINAKMQLKTLILDHLATCWGTSHAFFFFTLQTLQAAEWQWV